MGDVMRQSIKKGASFAHNSIASKLDAQSQPNWSKKAKWLLAGTSVAAVAIACAGQASASCAIPANGDVITCDESHVPFTAFVDDLDVTFQHSTPGTDIVHTGVGFGVVIAGNGSQSITLADNLDASAIGSAGMIVDSFGDTLNPGSVTIDTTQADVIADGNALYGRVSGAATGGIDIDTRDITTTNGFAIAARQFAATGGNIDIDTTAGTIAAGFTGVYADNQSTASDTMVTSADVSSAIGHGINVNHRVTNNGNISIDSTAGTIAAAVTGIAAYHFGSGNIDIDTAGVSGNRGIDALANGTVDIDVNGAVVGNTSDGIRARGALGNTINISNTGSVTGATSAIVTNTPANVVDTINNGGTIDGDVHTGFGNDVFTSTGTVTATSIIGLADDNDTANIGGTFSGILDLDFGNDTLNITDLSGLAGASFDGDVGTDALNIVATSGSFDAAQFVAFENFTVDNSAVTMVTTPAFFGSSNVINSASLDLGGQTLNSPVTVDASSTLMGSGTVNGAAIVNGTLHVGASDVMTINDPLGLTLNGALNVDYNSGAFGVVNVTGPVVTGVTQTVNFNIINPTGINHGSTFDVITSSGLTHGGAVLANDSFAGLDFDVVNFGGTNLQLQARATLNSVPSGDNNVDNAANALQALAMGAGAFTANPWLYTLASQTTTANLHQAIDELSPADGGVIPSMMRANTQMFADSMPGPCAENRVSPSHQTCSDMQKVRVWGAVDYSDETASQQVTANNTFNDADHSTSLLSAGFVVPVTQGLTAGASVGYHNSEFKERSKTEMAGDGKGYGVMAHANYQFGQAEVYGAVGKTGMDVDQKRTMFLVPGTVSSSQSTDVVFAKIGGRARWEWTPNVSLIPEASIMKMSGEIDAYNETGAPAGANLVVAKQDVDSTFGSFGATLEGRNLAGSTAQSALTGRIGYKYVTDFENDPMLVDASFQAGGPSFQTLLAKEEDSSHQIAAGLHGYFANGVGVSLDAKHRFNDKADETSVAFRLSKGW